MKLRHSLIAAIIFLPLPSTAADREPKEMRPKLIREGKVVIDDKFDAAELSKAWAIPAGDFAGTVKIEDGRAVIESGAGRQGAIWQKLDPQPADASVQALMKPLSCNWIGVRFMTPVKESDDRARQWQIAAVIYNNGYVRVVKPSPDGKSLVVIESAKTELQPGDWWRVSVESKGDRYLVRVNGEEMIDVKDKLAEGVKTGVLFNLYGGKGAVDEVKVMTEAAK